LKHVTNGIKRPSNDRDSLRRGMRGDHANEITAFATSKQDDLLRTRLHESIATMIASGDRARAAKSVSLALEAQSQSPEYFIRVARSAKQLDDAELERAALVKAFELGPIPQRLQVHLVDLCLKRDRVDEAEDFAARSSQGEPASETLFLKWISCLEISGKFDSAIEKLRARMIEIGRSEALLATWGRIMIDRMQRPDLALEELQHAPFEHDDWSTLLLRGLALASVGRADAALEHLSAATRLAPNVACVWFELGKLQRRMGDADGSTASLKRTLAIDPFNVTALRVVGHEHHHVYGDAIFRNVNLVMATAPELSRASEVEAHYAAAKAFEDVGERAVAYAHYRRAGQLQKRLSPWNDASLRRLANALQTHASSSWLQSVHDKGFPSGAPIFIVGMPRSGTSLVEQIIAAHPDVLGAGELKLGDRVLNGIRVGRVTIQTTKGDGIADPPPREMTLFERGHEYLQGIEQITGRSAVRITDKMPGNYMWLGLLAAVLPGARFIHCRRHPVASCLSQYKLYFGHEVPYSYDLRDLGRAYVVYDELMSHWSNVVPPSRLIDVNYERVVQDVEGEARRLMEFLDLPWSPSCLAFGKVKRQVRTASALQVRRPIYRTSVNRWRADAQFLKPLLDELGNLPKAYDEAFGDERSESRS
jgi:tetratricopeptide (TPR) repeat protein